MKILAIAPEGSELIESVSSGDSSLREYIKGDIEKIWLDQDTRLMMVFDEAGKLLGLPINKKATLIYQSYFNDEDTVEGTAVFCGCNRKGAPCSLTQAQIKELKVRLFTSRYLIDSDNILSCNPVEGVYEVRFLNKKKDINISAYIGEQGRIDSAPWYAAQNISERINQHLHAWIGNDLIEYWLGLTDKDLDDGWKVEIRILSIESDRENRKKLESYYIDKNLPFLQYSANGRFQKYHSDTYIRNDIAIFPWNSQRREAFLYRVESLKPR